MFGVGGYDGPVSKGRDGSTNGDGSMIGSFIQHGTNKGIDRETFDLNDNLIMVVMVEEDGFID
jgi:hypothetical protein